MFIPFGSNSTAPGDNKCCYWSSTIDSENLNKALHLHAEENNTDWSWSANRYAGMLIRPI